MELTNRFNLVDYNKVKKEGEQGDYWRDRIGDRLFDTAVFFAGTIGGDYYCWDESVEPLDNDLEFPIYYIPRDGNPKYCAASFVDWIVKVCLAPAEDEEGKPRWYFRRFYTG